MLVIGLGVVGLLFQLIFIYVEKKGEMKKALLFKMMAASLFVVAGFIGLQKCTDRRFASFIVLGLLFGWLGDFFMNYRFLSQKQKVVFLIGAMSFFTNHVFYIVALTPFMEGTFIKAILVTGVALVTITRWIVKQAEVNAGLKIFGYVYLSALTFITAETLFMFLANPENTGILIMCIGAAFFTVSDYLLILNAFSSRKKNWMRPANLLFYYLGQMIIVCSLMYYVNETTTVQSDTTYQEKERIVINFQDNIDGGGGTYNFIINVETKEITMDVFHFSTALDVEHTKISKSVVVTNKYVFERLIEIYNLGVMESNWNYVYCILLESIEQIVNEEIKALKEDSQWENVYSDKDINNDGKVTYLEDFEVTTKYMLEELNK